MDMKGIILAGGTGSRLRPLTNVTNKHLLAVGRKPMIFYPVEKLVSAGIKEILIITGVEHMGHVVELLGSGKEFGCRFTYKVQDEAGGIAQALGLAENFCGSSPMVVVLGDNIFKASLKKYIERFKESQRAGGARLLLKKVNDPQRFGVAHIDGDKITVIREKPKDPQSPYAVIGVYFYNSDVFDIIRTLEPSGRGELEITDVNNAYISKGRLFFDIIDGWWSDAGTFNSLNIVNELVIKDPPQ